jgi:DNA ligase-1
MLSLPTDSAGHATHVAPRCQILYGKRCKHVVAAQAAVARPSPCAVACDAMQLSAVVATWDAVARTRSRLEKIERLATLLRGLDPAEIPVTVSYLSGELPQGAIGIGWAAVKELPSPAARPSLQIRDVDACFELVLRLSGRGSQAARRREIASLFGRATELEQRFLLGLLAGELRQGALQGVMVEAVARAAGAAASEVRRGSMVAGDLGRVAAAALAGGAGGLIRFRMTVFRPLQPMLAHSAPDVATALEKIRPASVEWKLDGARLQLHRQGAEVRAFTRNLAEVTDRVPEVVSAVARLPVEATVVDGEVIALRDDGRPHPFQVTLGRFGSRLEVERARASTPLSLFLFDCLHLDGQDLIDRPASERFAALTGRAPPELVVPRAIAHDADAAAAVLDDALARGHEGVMVKSLEAPYEAGRRGAAWLKVKRARTLDLVVLAAEWGHGRRRGWLSNLHLGARGAGPDDFVMLGKTFKGMTDDMLAWQTARLLELETGRDGITVFVKPELVVEVAFDGVQKSSRYPGGLALRFARVKRYRLDKRPQDADSYATVRAIANG